MAELQVENKARLEELHAQYDAELKTKKELDAKLEEVKKELDSVE